MTIEGFLSGIETALKAAAGSAAVIGVMGLAFMYLGSSFPIVSDWKASHPKAASDVTIGLCLLVLVGSGGLATLVAF